MIVPKKGSNDDFSFTTLIGESTIYHKDCGSGGKMNIKYSGRESGGHYYEAVCSRCALSGTIIFKGSHRAMICKTAIDGEERKLTSDIRVRRRDTTTR
jgi:hypothetical protein